MQIPHPPKSQVCLRDHYFIKGADEGVLKPTSSVVLFCVKVDNWPQPSGKSWTFYLQDLSMTLQATVALLGQYLTKY